MITWIPCRTASSIARLCYKLVGTFCGFFLTRIGIFKNVQFMVKPKLRDISASLL
ncbi:MAG: hypothetical protein HYV28_17635 [Ignavibacteriales bacterium]|nr:hypothetical protein [Ignavibacteriales bacterium]